jgi:hypothetical protein
MNKKIVIVDSEVRKNKKYLPLKQEIPFCFSNNDSTWFTFSHQGLYHPVGIIDENGQFITTSATVEMLVSLQGDSSRDYKVCAKNRKGIYWFSAIRVHVPGRVMLRFSVPDDSSIEPLESVSIVVDENGDPLEAIDAAKDANIEICVDDSVDSHLARTVVEDIASTVMRSTRASKKNMAVEPIRDLEYNSVDISTEIQSTDMQLQSKISQPPQLLQSIQEVPRSDPLPLKSRLERKWKLNGNKSFSSINITETASKLKLPSGLFRGLLYDKEVVSPLICSCWHENQFIFKGLKRKRNSLEESFKRLMSPCVYDLLHMLESSFKIPHSTTVFLIFLFETKAFSTLLYAEEQTVFAEYFNESKEQKRFVSQFFGPYYFLRFIIAIAMSIGREGIHIIIEMT